MTKIKEAEEALRAIGRIWDGIGFAVEYLHKTGRLNAVPEGWKLVPIEPTLEMIGATNECADCIGDIWRTMLEHAPTPPTENT